MQTGVARRAACPRGAADIVAALVTVDQEAAAGWLQWAGRAGDIPLADLVDDPDLRGAVAEAVQDANRAVSRAEQIRAFRILPVDFTEAGGGADEVRRGHGAALRGGRPA